MIYFSIIFHFEKLSKILLCIASILLFGQNKTYVYEAALKTKPLDKDFVEREQYYLDSNQDMSIFRSAFEKKSDSLVFVSRFGFGRNIDMEKQIYVVNNKKTGQLYKSYITSRRAYYSVAIDQKPVWKILPQTKTINSFKVQKATTDYGGRKWTAWFSPDIPVQEGPYIFKGLPGLIIEISDEDNDYVFELSSIKNFSGDFYQRNSGLNMSMAEFQKLMLNFYLDPYADQKARGRPIYKNDGYGGMVKYDFNEATKNVQEIIRTYNNPLELNYKNQYK